MDVVRLKLTVAYDGRGYEGWQCQRAGRSVQQQVELALAKVLGGGPHRLHSSSRTDAGVHALGMVAHVDVPRARWRMTPAKLRLAVNAHLPEDVRVMEARRAAAAFHARFQATGKRYLYTVWNHPAMNPLLRGRAWHVPSALDLAAMKQAARLFVGRHDFRSFAANRGQALQNAVRNLWRCDLTRRGPELRFVLEGDGFLYKMCRAIVGTVVQVGRGRFAVADVSAMLAAEDRRVAGMTAPAEGLLLAKVFYGRRAGSAGETQRAPG